MTDLKLIDSSMSLDEKRRISMDNLTKTYLDHHVAINRFGMDFDPKTASEDELRGRSFLYLALAVVGLSMADDEDPGRSAKN